jgi:hypothetical protein
METLTKYLLSDQIVTARWLSNTEGCSVAEARKLLDDYTKDETILCSYLLHGADGHRSRYVISSEDNLEKTKGKFDNLHSCQLYSIQKKSDALSNKEFAVALHNTDQQQAESLLNGDNLDASCNTSDNFIHNKIGSIKQDTPVSIKPIGQRNVADMKKAKPSSSGSAFSNGMSAGTSSSKGESALDYMSSKFAQQAEKGTASKKSTISASDFFKSAPKTKGDVSKKKKSNTKKNSENDDEDSLPPWEKDSSDTKKSVSPKKSKKKTIITDDDEEEEFDDGSGHKANKDNLKKRKMALGMPQGEGGLHESDMNVADDENEDNSENSCNIQNDNKGDEEEGNTKKVSKAGANVHVHGGIDDWREDDAISAAQQDKPKRRKIKTVEKLYMDEKGYMVKRMVEEEVTDDEEEAPVRRAPEKKASVLKTSPKKAKPVEKKSKPAGAGQSSMMSFFSKK